MSTKLRKLRAPVVGSSTDWLNSFRVGERRYCELKQIDKSGNLGRAMRKLLPFRTRWPEAMRHKNFSVAALTAVGAGKLGDVRVLLCVTRTADSKIEL